ncbi:MAG: hypothetical protein ABIO99_09455 [Candidatus Limnocylindria bacterium]
MSELDHRVRLAAFQWLRAQMDVHGEVLPRSVLAEGFVHDGRRVPLLIRGVPEIISLMRYWVGITDWDWFSYLAERPELPEVNFWQPSAGRRPVTLEPAPSSTWRLP